MKIMWLRAFIAVKNQSFLGKNGGWFSLDTLKIL